MGEQWEGSGAPKTEIKDKKKKKKIKAPKTDNQGWGKW